MNNRETVRRRTTRYWQSGRREQPAPAPARHRPPSQAHPGGCRPAGSFFLPRRRQLVYASLRHLVAAETTKAPETPRPLKLVCRRRLLQRGVDRGELGVQVAAEAVDDGNDRQRNAGCKKAVFDSGGAGLILHETRNQVLHW